MTSRAVGHACTDLLMAPCGKADIIYYTQIRRPIGTVFELLIPALALAVVVGIRSVQAHIHTKWCVCT